MLTAAVAGLPVSAPSDGVAVQLHSSPAWVRLPCTVSPGQVVLSLLAGVPSTLQLML